MSNIAIHSISVVIPVYSGSSTLRQVVGELSSFYLESISPKGNQFKICEVILVDDCGQDDSARVISELAASDSHIMPIWLMRNFGQHAATIAGMASTSSEWVVTMDEDGQHNPSSIGALLDTALINKCQLVYGRMSNREPHGVLRNTISKSIKKFVLPLLIGKNKLWYFSSFRLMTGEMARVVGAFANQGAYLDIALSWIVRSTQTCDVVFRNELRTSSGYTIRKLIAHFMRLVLSSGTRPLRLITTIGTASFVAGVVGVVHVVIGKLSASYDSNGWASLVSLLLILGGLMLFALGIIAEYIGVLVRRAMGMPLYVVGIGPNQGPLREQH